MKRPIRLAALAATAVLATGAGAIGAHAAGAKVAVKLTEFRLVPSAKRAAPGMVTFVARNAGKIPHELVVLRTARLAGKLPTSGVTAVETGKVGKIAVLQPGSAKTLTLTLKKGHYALICNLPGHYKAGQFADFIVG